jgi:putative ABC transport system permease protein
MSMQPGPAVRRFVLRLHDFLRPARAERELIACGIALGLSGAAAVTRYLESLLFALAPLDVPTFLTVSLLFAIVATLASYVPARRATRVDPLIALRDE